MRVKHFVCLLICGLCSAVTAAEQLPRSRDPRIKISLFAEHPQIVTPTGIDIDSNGRVWAIESNTHFRPNDYKGHESDRLLVMSDTDGDGRADKIITFADGFKYAMSVVVRPSWFPQVQINEKTGKPEEIRPDDKRWSSKGVAVYVATRREILLLEDLDGDLKVDRRTRIVQLDSKGDYPHNGLAGFALHPAGYLYFGMGENLGEKYSLYAENDIVHTGGGEGGNIFSCRPDGKSLTRVATGFWNPYANCFDAYGRLFSVDNDPDSRPPCRLLHVIPGGDYGYRYRNGRTGLHPFTSWNGEIPGTLPMVAGTGEAPSGIVSYESVGLPDEYRGNLLVTSWGDHRIDRFRLQPRGTSFSSIAEPLIVGGENFRPVGLACAPDGSLYCTDWMLKDYNLHGHGRIWRIAAVQPQREIQLDLAEVIKQTPEQAGRGLNSKRLESRREWAQTLANQPDTRKLLRKLAESKAVPTAVRVEALWSLVRRHDVPNIFGVPVITNVVPQFETDTTAATTAYTWLAYPSSSIADRGLRAWVLSRERKSLQPARPLEIDNTLLLALAHVDRARDPFLELQERAQTYLQLSSGNDPFVFSAVVSLLEMPWGKAVLPTGFRPDGWKDSRLRLALLIALRRQQPQNTERLKWFVLDRDPQIRRAVLQWIAEERLEKFRSVAIRTLEDPQLSTDLFLATLATLEMLDGVAPAAFDKTPPGKYVLPLVNDERRPASVRALALRLVNPEDPALTGKLFEKLLENSNPGLKLETVRTLKMSSLPESAGLLRRIAADAAQEPGLRLEAIAGLGREAQSPGGDRKLIDFLLGLALEKKSTLPLRIEALRGLRGAATVLENDAASRDRIQAALAEEMSEFETHRKTSEVQELIDQLGKAFSKEFEQQPKLAALRSRRPANRHEWLQTVGAGDAVAGSRIFFHPNSAGCYRCHTINGRGGKVGPDLSTIGRSLTRERLLDSILEPSREIAPQYVTWSIETRQGKVLSGMIVHENAGKTVLGDNTGKLTDLKTIDIVERVPQKTSVMPERLVDQLTVQELRDLVAFLESLR